MQWVSNLFLSGANDDSLILSTWNKQNNNIENWYYNAGCWADDPLSSNRRYICEKND